MAAVLAFVAVAVFVATPFLLEHHHHSDLVENTQCAVCLLASAHITPAPATIDVALELTSIRLARTPDETLTSGPRTHTRNERAPPAA